MGVSAVVAAALSVSMPIFPYYIAGSKHCRAVTAITSSIAVYIFRVCGKCVRAGVCVCVHVNRAHYLCEFNCKIFIF